MCLTGSQLRKYDNSTEVTYKKAKKKTTTEVEAGYTAFSFSLQIVITSFSHPEITLVSLFYKQNFFIREYKLYENTIQAQMF